MSNLTAFETCLPKSIPGPSALLSIPNFTISNPYPSIKNSKRMKTMIPTTPTPPRAKLENPFD